jgi:hypothetical protein
MEGWCKGEENWVQPSGIYLRAFLFSNIALKGDAI